MAAQAVAVPQRSVIGIMARSKQDGKSTLARLLHVAFGNSEDAASDLEYSDVLDQITSDALQRGNYRSFGGFCWQLIESSSRMIGIEVRPSVSIPPDTCDCSDHDRAKCPVWNLQIWYRQYGTGPKRLQVVDRANKLAHRATEIYLGIMVRRWVDAGVWASELGRRIEAIGKSRLITVGGVRFPEDAAVIWGDCDPKNGLVVQVIGRATQPDDDPTNALNSQIPADVVFWNNTHDPHQVHLGQAVRQFHADWQTGWLQPEYGSKLA